MSLFQLDIPKDLHIHLTIKSEQDTQTIKYLQEISEILIKIHHQNKTIMSNTDQALADLQVISGTLTKVSTESTTLLQKITDLENATTPDTPQAVLDAIAAVKAQAQAIDDLVPDAPAPTV